MKKTLLIIAGIVTVYSTILFFKSASDNIKKDFKLSDTGQCEKDFDHLAIEEFCNIQPEPASLELIAGSNTPELPIDYYKMHNVDFGLGIIDENLFDKVYSLLGGIREKIGNPFSFTLFFDDSSLTDKMNMNKVSGIAAYSFEDGMNKIILHFYRKCADSWEEIEKFRSEVSRISYHHLVFIDYVQFRNPDSTMKPFVILTNKNTPKFKKKKKDEFSVKAGYLSVFSKEYAYNNKEQIVLTDSLNIKYEELKKKLVAADKYPNLMRKFYKSPLLKTKLGMKIHNYSQSLTTYIGSDFPTGLQLRAGMLYLDLKPSLEKLFRPDLYAGDVMINSKTSKRLLQLLNDMKIISSEPEYLKAVNELSRDIEFLSNRTVEDILYRFID